MDEQFRETTSRAYWLRKIRRNMDRDCRVSAALLADGWSVVRLWESEVLHDSALAVEKALSVPRATLRTAPEKTFAEFFAGIGLMRVALEKHGWTTTYANDIDPKKLEMYHAHFGSGFDLGDIHEVAPRAIPAVTLATASFPAMICRSQAPAAGSARPARALSGDSSVCSRAWARGGLR